MRRAVLFTLVLVLSSCERCSKTPDASPGAGTDKAAGPVPPPGGEPAAPLTFTDDKVGEGPAPADGALVRIHYVEKDAAGQLIDDTHGRAPTSLYLRADTVLPGLYQGMKGMHEGGTRTVDMAPELAGRGAGGKRIVFKIELLAPDAPGTTPVPPNHDKELKITDVKVGKGAVAKEGGKVTVHFIEKADGKLVDDTHGRPPLELILRQDVTIRGLYLGLKGMKVGGKRKLTMPGSLAAGQPDTAVIVFDVELLKAE